MDEMVANSPWQIAIFSDMFGENGGCKNILDKMVVN